jgi:hypothetical protein
MKDDGIIPFPIKGFQRQKMRLVGMPPFVSSVNGGFNSLSKEADRFR